MDICSYKGVTYEFDGFLSNTSFDIGDTIVFFNTNSVYVFKILVNGNESPAKVHTALVESIWEEFDLQYSVEMREFVVDLDDIVSIMTSGKDYTFGFLVEEYTNTVGRKSSSLYNLYVRHGQSLYPASYMNAADKCTEVYYGDTLMLRVATDIERFPSIVSYNILQRHIDLLTKERTMGKKILGLQQILDKGLHVTYTWDI